MNKDEWLQKLRDDIQNTETDTEACYGMQFASESAVDEIVAIVKDRILEVLEHLHGQDKQIEREQLHCIIKVLRDRGIPPYGFLAVQNCRCGNPGKRPHVCPCKSSLDDDKETLCNCCDKCTTECRLEV